jgi:hypothetical protein
MKNIYLLFCGLAVAFSSLYAQNEHVSRDNPNVLKMAITGGDYGYADELFIYFIEGATPNYDVEMESIKWYSIYPDATMIWSIAGDGTELAINAMPLSCLYNGCTDIPVHFQCGYDDEYSLTFSGMDTFEYPTEFWIEDLNDPSNWINVNNEMDTYTFTGYVSDSSFNRFVIHFMDPTGITPGTVKRPRIYAAAQSVVIETEAPETIKDIQIFDLVGNEVNVKHGNFDKRNKLYVSGQIGYYFVKVDAGKNVYTQKIFIGY